MMGRAFLSRVCFHDAWALALLSAFALLGCDGVGRALVDSQPVDNTDKELCAEPIPRCIDQPLPDEPVGLPPDAAPIDLETCGARTVCPIPIQGLSGADGMPPAGCGPAENPDQSTQALAALAVSSCTRVRIVDDGTGESAPDAELDQAQIESVNVTLESKRPWNVRLRSAALQHAWFELHGPITLRIEDSEGVNDLRVFTPEPEAGRAALILENVRLDGVAIGNSQLDFAGSVAIRRTSLRHGSIRADTIELESVSMSDLQLATGRLDASDATLSRLTVSAERTLLSACTVSAARFSDCVDFSAILGSLRTSRLDGCSEPARLYGTSFTEGLLDGPLVLDHASLSYTRLGLHQQSEIQAWDSQVSHVRFCGPTQSISFAGQSGATCVRCEAMNSEPRKVDACVTKASSYELFDTAEACEGLKAPPECGDPEPMRMRPPY